MLLKAQHAVKGYSAAFTEQVTNRGWDYHNGAGELELVAQVIAVRWDCRDDTRSKAINRLRLLVARTTAHDRLSSTDVSAITGQQIEAVC